VPHTYNKLHPCGVDKLVPAEAGRLPSKVSATAGVTVTVSLAADVAVFWINDRLLHLQATTGLSVGHFAITNFEWHNRFLHLYFH
jgi:hypothetical protein